VGLDFPKRTLILSRIHFTKRFIEFVFVETKRLVDSYPNVILTWQTCCQRSSMSAESKRRTLVFHFPVRICCAFLISKCRKESDLGQCTTLVLAKRILLQGGDLRFENMFGRKICEDLRNGILFANTKVVHRPRSDSLLHFDIRKTWQIYTPK